MVKLKQKQTEERILTGKTDKLDPELKKRMKDQRLEERFEIENKQMRSGSDNNYELIYPRLYEPEKNAKYEEFLKKANDLWDEFTTGAKGKKRAAEMQEANKKAEAMEKKALQAKKKNAEKRLKFKEAKQAALTTAMNNYKKKEEAKEEIINDIVENKLQFRMDTHDDNEEKE